MLHCSWNRPGVFVPSNTNTTHIGSNIHGYLEKYPPCTFQTQTRGVELRKFQVLGSKKIFTQIFFHTLPLRGYPPKKSCTPVPGIFFSTPPPHGVVGTNLVSPHILVSPK